MAKAALQTFRNGDYRFDFDPKGKYAVRLNFYGPNPLCDIDNLVKLVLDGIADTFWANDRQVMHISAWKHFGMFKGKEFTSVEVEQIE